MRRLDSGGARSRRWAGAIAAGALLLASLSLSSAAAQPARDPSLQRARALDAESREHLRKGQNGDALQKAQEALALRERALGPANPEVVTSLVTVADILQQSRRPGAARAPLERALQVLTQAHGPHDPRLVPVLDRLGASLRGSGDWVGARSVLQRAADIVERTPPTNAAESRDAFVTFLTLGFVLDKTGDYVMARQALERAMRILERQQRVESIEIIKTGEYLADVLERIGEYQSARPLRERSLAFHESRWPDSLSLADRLTAMAGLLHALGEDAGARQAVERAIGISTRFGTGNPPLARALIARADLLRAAGDNTGARASMDQALPIIERTYGPRVPWTAEMHTKLAELLALTGDRARARSHYERALVIARKLAAPEPRWRAALGLGTLEEEQGQAAGALPLYREAVTAVEALASQFTERAARQRYLDAAQRLAVYDALARALLKLHEQDPGRGHDREAMAVLEAKRGRIAAEALAATRPMPADPAVRSAIDEVRARHDQALAVERELRDEQAKPGEQQDAARIQELTVLLARTKTEYLDRVRDFLARYPKHKAQFVEQQTVDPKLLAKLADRLPSGTLIVEYLAVPDALYLFLVGAGGRFQVIKRAVAQEDLYALVEEYRRHLELGARGRLPWAEDRSAAYRQEVTRFKQVTRELAGHLLEPLGPELEAHRDLIVVANDVLLYLPFHALTRAAPDGVTRFLAETHTVSYMTQLEVVDVLSPAAPAGPRPLLAMGNPDGSLPWAGEEVRALRGARQTVLTFEGADATKATFLRLVGQLHPDLHLATHGVFDPLRPGRSYLVMAGPDARLGIGEIAGLELGGGLAILSACDTALGETIPGAALISLAAAFSQAGAQSVVASLWRVNDEATRDFMVTYHAALRASGRAAALRTAQLALMARPETAHPYYWAPFILIGTR